MAKRSNNSPKNKSKNQRINRKHKRIRIEHKRITESDKTMEKYIKDLLEEFKANGIICTKKEKYYLITLE